MHILILWVSFHNLQIFFKWGSTNILDETKKKLKFIHWVNDVLVWQHKTLAVVFSTLRVWALEEWVNLQLKGSQKSAKRFVQSVLEPLPVNTYVLIFFYFVSPGFEKKEEKRIERRGQKIKQLIWRRRKNLCFRCWAGHTKSKKFLHTFIAWVWRVELMLSKLLC